MKEAAAILVGEHDFSAFCSAGSQVKSKVRTIYEVSLDKQKAMGCNGGEVIRIRVRGNGFYIIWFGLLPVRLLKSVRREEAWRM